MPIFLAGHIALTRQFIENIPIPAAPAPAIAAAAQVGRWLSFLYRQPSVRSPNTEQPRDPQLAAWFERWANALVYELFFPKELQSRGLSFLAITEDLAPPVTTNAATTLSAVRATVERLSAPGHALRRALDQLQTLDLVRTIEGGA